MKIKEFLVTKVSVPMWLVLLSTIFIAKNVVVSVTTSIPSKEERQKKKLERKYASLEN